MSWRLALLLSIVAAGSVGRAENLLKNPGFELRDKKVPQLPAFWTEGNVGVAPLEFSPEHYEGKVGGVIVGDGKEHMWRQNLLAPKFRTFTLSAFVRAEKAVMLQDGNAFLYGHIIYKNKPYETATHFYAKLPPGTYDWKPISVAAAAHPENEIELVHISITGKLSSGRICVDQVEVNEDITLTPEALLTGKVSDLLKQLDRVGEVDASVAKARAQLMTAKASLTQKPANVPAAAAAWVKACDSVSHQVWAVMFPQAMSDKPVEAQMMYHGMGQTKEYCDQRLDLIQKAGCNAIYDSLGSWMSVIYHSDVIPVEPGWDKFDAFSYFIKEAHRRGIKVFGYLAALYGAHDIPDRPGSIARLHPEWFAKGPDPNMPRFPDPANPEVAEFVIRAYTELAKRYPLDGVGLDYIRYPTENCLNYDENNRKQIMERYGFDIMGSGDLWKDPDKWAKIREYRAEKVGQLVKRVRDAVKATRPDVTVIACLISDPDEARDGYGQNWARSSQWLDYATPMNYFEVSKDEQLLVRQRDICGKNQAVFIPAIGGMPEVHQSWTLSTWAERVAIQRKVGCDGIIIYRLGDFDPAVAAFFGQGAFYSKAKFPEPMKR